MTNASELSTDGTMRRRLIVGAVCAGLFLAGCGAVEPGTDEASAVGSPTSSAASGSASSGSVSSAGSSTGSSTSASSSALFDSATVQDIEITFDEAAYDAMIEAYSSSGEKEWIDATVTINGVTFEQVGMRLKGNSSLSGLRNGGAGRGGPSGTVSADDPAGLPWLIRLDRSVDGQSYEGATELVVRSNSSETALNEALALELLDEAGLATQASAHARLSINGSDAALRLIVENPNDEWDAEAFATDGILYKAEAGGDYSYRGDDPEAYADVFDQETDTDTDDLAPLIAFLDFINNSSDEEFAADLDEHLDVESFATYLAIEDLMGNFDDIDGPGNNSYLRIDTETGRATVVAWDHNLAFGTMGGGMGGGAGGAARGGQVPPGGGVMPGGGALPDGVAVPDGGALPGDGEGPGGGAVPGGRAGGPGGGSNILVTRFKAVPELAARYDDALAALRTELYDSGVASTILERRAEVLRTQASDVVDAATVDAEVERLATQVA